MSLVPLQLAHNCPAQQPAGSCVAADLFKSSPETPDLTEEGSSQGLGPIDTVSLDLPTWPSWLMEYGYSYEVHDERPRKPPPEEVAQGLRVAILTRLQHYRQLWLGITQRPQTCPPDATHGANFQAIQVALLRDIRTLAHLTARRERKLESQKWVKWFLNPLLPVLLHYLYLQLYKLPELKAWTPLRERNDRGQIRPAYLTVLSLIPWFAGPAALYRLFTYEEQVDRTARLQETLGDMEAEVDRGYLVRDIGSLELSTWEDIRWHPELFPL